MHLSIDGNNDHFEEHKHGKQYQKQPTILQKHILQINQIDKKLSSAKVLTDTKF